MRKIAMVLISLISISGFAAEVTATGDTGWHPAEKNPAEKFSDAENNFNLVMKKLLEKYVDKNISREDLYKAATAGMLSSLNSEDGTWNKLMSPRDFAEMEAEFSGKFTGIGAAIKFDDHNGYGQIIHAIAGSAAEKAGLQADDQILSVNGKKYKGKHLIDLVKDIRGEIGKSVELKILREDKILNISIKREPIPWSTVTFESAGNSTDILAIASFNEETPKAVEEKLQEVAKHRTKKLILDLRNNEGGGFDQAVRVAELFLPENAIVASTKGRDGKVETFRSHKGVLPKDVQLVILTNKGTFCGAELLVAAIKENSNVKIVGETTFGKWSAQNIETLSNHYAIKYTIKEFQSPLGHTFQGQGIKPDLEVSMPKDFDANELRTKYSVEKRVALDPQLKAALELMNATL